MQTALLQAAPAPKEQAQQKQPQLQELGFKGGPSILLVPEPAAKQSFEWCAPCCTHPQDQQSYGLHVELSSTCH